MASSGSAEALTRILVALGLGAARAVPIVWLIPAFGGRDLAAPLRVGMGVGLASLALPRLMTDVAGAAGAGLAHAGPVAWTLLATRELLIGATVGLVVSFAFHAAQAAGGLVDVLRGANLGQVLAPVAAARAGARTSPLGALYLLSAVVIFLELGGLGRMAVAFGRSYDAVPLIGDGAGRGATALTASTAAGLRGAAGLVLTASAQLIESAVGLAAPAIVALLLADLALGALARIAPATPIYFAAMPLKALLGVGVVLVGLGALDAALVAGLPAWIKLAERGFGLWAG